MSDPVTAGIASVLTILDATIKVIKLMKAIKHAKEDMERVVSEMVTLHELLSHLKKSIEQNRPSWETTRKLFLQENGPLEKFEVYMLEMKSKLEPKDSSHKRMMQKIRWPFQKEEVDQFLQNVERFKSAISLALSSDSITLQRHMEDSVDAISRISLGREMHEVLHWLCPLDFALQQRDLTNRRTKGTNQLFLNSDEFQTWFNRRKQILIGYGIPGAGKTMTSSAVIQRLEESSGDKSIGLAYVFCDYKKRDEQNGPNFIASLLKQLICGRREGIPKDLRDLYEKDHPPTLDVISKLFQSQVGKNAYTYIVIDALDECGDEGNTEARRTLLSRLCPLLSTDKLGLMITSRPTNKLNEDDFGQRPLELEITASKGDLDAYLSSPEVMGRLRLWSLIANKIELQQKIKDAIIEAADGIFILAHFLLEYLRDLSSEKQLKKALETLPAGKNALNSVYDQTMQRITALDTNSRESAMRILTWVTYACRPLSIIELQHALAVEVDEDSFDDENISDIEQDISRCAGLVTIERENKTVQLCHKTVHEYLSLREADLFPQAQRMLAETCLKYLCYDVFRGGRCKGLEKLARLANNPFLGYSAQYWGEHAFANEDGELIERIQTFFKKTGNMACASQVMLKTERFDCRYIRYTKQGKYKSRRLSAVHICAFFGLTTLLADILKKGSKVDDCDDAGRTPLWWACVRGQKSAVSLLLEKGADIFTVSEDSRSVLQEAAGNASPEIFQLLFRHACNDHVGGDLLSCAAANELWGSDIVEFLFQSEFSISNEGKGRVIMAAVKNHQRGRKILGFLAYSRGWDIKISDEMIEVLSQDFYSGADKLDLLLSLDTGRNLDSIISQIAARGVVSEVLGVLLKHQPEYHFTHDEIVATAEHNDEMLLVALEHEKRLQLSQMDLEEIVQKAAITPSSVEAMLEHSNLEITESVMICATKNPWNSRVLEWLLDHPLRTGGVSESLFVQAAGSEKASSMLEALARHAPGFKVTPIVMIAAIFAPSLAGHEALQWLLSYDTGFAISETLFMAGRLRTPLEKKKFLKTHFSQINPALLRLVNVNPDEYFRDAVKSERLRLLSSRSPAMALSKGVLSAAGYYLLEDLEFMISQQHNIADAEIVEGILIPVMTDSRFTEIINTVLSHVSDASIVISSAILEAAAQNFNADALRWSLERYTGSETVPACVVRAAVRGMYGIEKLQILRAYNPNTFQVTEEALVEVCRERKWGVKTLQWIFAEYPSIRVTESATTIAAASAEYGIEKLTLLRAHDPNNFQVTEETLVKVCRVWKWGLTTLQWIFAEYPSLRVAESAVMMAAAQSDAVVKLELIMKHDPDIQITENILTSTIIKSFGRRHRLATLEWLLNRQKVHITERTLIAAARTRLDVKVFEILNDYQPGFDICSTVILQAAAENFYGPETLQWLLTRNSNDTTDPAGPLSAQAAMDTFLQRQSQPRITERMIAAAVGDGWRGETLEILLKHSITFSVTTEILKNVSNWEGGSRALQLLLEKTSHGPISQDLIDTLDESWKFAGGVFDILNAHNEKCSL